MKILERILNNYFNNIYKRNLKSEILMAFILDVEIREYKNGMCELAVKPPEYKNYTIIYDWHKGDAFNHLVNLQKAEVRYLKEKIKAMKWGVYK